MSAVSLRRDTLAATLWPAAEGGARLLRAALLVLAGSALMTLSAKIQVPFYPVPLSMQTLAALMLGMAYGWRLGALTVVFYLAQGALGLPVFANSPERGLGLAYLAGPTGGYLVGFALAAAVAGWLAERGWDRNVATTALAMLLGNLAIYVPGLLWLGNLIGWDKPVLALGLTPFILGDLTKLALAALAMPLAWRLVRGRGGTHNRQP